MARATSASVSVTFSPARNAYAMPLRDPLHNTASPYTVDISGSPYKANLVGGTAGTVGAAAPTATMSTPFAVTFNGFGDPTAIGWLIVRVGDTSRLISIDAAAQTSVSKLTDAGIQSRIATFTTGSMAAQTGSTGP